MAKKKYYAVRKGKQTGIFDQWFGPKGAQIQVTGFPGAEFKSFPTRAEAEQFLLGIAKEDTAEEPLEGEHTTVFTDGGAVGNPGPGGYGVVLLFPDGRRQELCGGFKLTTNNRMELMGCIAALEALPGETSIVLHSDSRYLVDAVNKGWVFAWQKRGWKKANGEPALNIDLWKRLLKLLDESNVVLKWVKGHAGNVWNERCDQLVHEAIRKGDLQVDAGYDTGTANKRLKTELIDSPYSGLK